MLTRDVGSCAKSGLPWVTLLLAVCVCCTVRFCCSLLRPCSFCFGSFWFACVFEGAWLQWGLAPGHNLSLAVKLNYLPLSNPDLLWWPGSDTSSLSSSQRCHEACAALTVTRDLAHIDSGVGEEAEATVQRAPAVRVGGTSLWFLAVWTRYKETSLLWSLLSNPCSRINRRYSVAYLLSNTELPSWRSHLQLQSHLLSIEGTWTWIIQNIMLLGLSVLVRLKDLFATVVLGLLGLLVNSLLLLPPWAWAPGLFIAASLIPGTTLSA